MGAVPEFGRAILADLDAPRGRISTYAEVQLKDAGGKLSIPDGAIVVERGQTRWSCLVEVKSAGAPLKPEQVARYLDMAREPGSTSPLLAALPLIVQPAAPDARPPALLGRRRTIGRSPRRASAPSGGRL